MGGEVFFADHPHWPSRAQALARLRVWYTDLSLVTRPWFLSFFFREARTTRRAERPNTAREGLTFLFQQPPSANRAESGNTHQNVPRAPQRTLITPIEVAIASQHHYACQVQRRRQSARSVGR